MSLAAFKKVMEPAPELRPYLNVGGIWDIITGKMVLGTDGQYYCSGGVPHVLGVVGRGNTFKSTLMHYLNLATLNNYPDAAAFVYDTEPPALSYPRLSSISGTFPSLQKDPTLFTSNSERVLLSDSTMESGEVMFSKARGVLKARVEDKASLKSITRQTPFMDSEGKQITALAPFNIEIDSLSMMPFSHTEEIHDKNEIGDGATNTLSMRQSGAKSMLVSQMAHLPAATGSHWMFSAHLGDDTSASMRGQYAPSQKKLQFLKQDQKIKNVPENFTFLTNVLVQTEIKEVLVDNNKRPLYPLSKDENIDGNKDLNAINVTILRNKQGPSGGIYPFVVSQSKGVDPTASAFHYCRTEGWYGIEVAGNKQDYAWALLPELSFTRHNLRDLGINNRRFYRAAEITAQILAMEQTPQHAVDWGKYIVKPKKLREFLTELGFDIEFLLDRTQSIYQFGDSKFHQIKTLSTLDILRMAKGEFKPVWYDAEYAKYKEEVAKTEPETKATKAA